MATRRAQLRAELTDQIKDTALAHLRDHGADGLSLRAIARDVGLSAPGMYRYFDSRDELLTALITEGYDDLADHVLTAVGRTGDMSDRRRPTPQVPIRTTPDAAPATRFRAAAHAYRHWSVAHPHEFGLLYGTPIVGYAAPEGGPTVRAVQRMSTALLAPLVEAHLAGHLHIPTSFGEHDVTSATEQMRADIIELAGSGIPRELPALLLAAWSRIHGLVTLEVFHQFAFAFGDNAVALFEADLAAMVDQLFTD